MKRSDPGSGINKIRIGPDADAQHRSKYKPLMLWQVRSGGAQDGAGAAGHDGGVPPRLPCGLQPRLQHGGGRQLCPTQVGRTTVPPCQPRRLQPRLQHGGGGQLCPTQVGGTTVPPRRL